VLHHSVGKQRQGVRAERLLALSDHVSQGAALSQEGIDPHPPRLVRPHPAHRNPRFLEIIEWPA